MEINDIKTETSRRFTKSIYFRFSNTTGDSAHDTINEHITLLNEAKERGKAEVFWGIWLKEYESFEIVDVVGSKCKYLRFSKVSGEIDFDNNKLFLLNIKDKCIYSFIGRIVKKEQVNEKLIPEYYRANKNDIEYWLHIESIKSIDWPQKLSEKINLASDDIVIIENRIPQLKELAIQKRGILHISDLHFGDISCSSCSFAESTNDIRRNATKLLDKFPTDLDIGLIIASGDFIHAKLFDNKEKEKVTNYFNRVEIFLNSLCNRYNLNPKTHLLLVPGNHDIHLIGKEKEEKLNNTYDYEYKRFQLKIIGEDQLSYCRRYKYEGHSIIFSCFNSSDLASVENRDYGYIDPRQFFLFDYQRKIPFESSQITHFSIMHHPICGPQIIEVFPELTNENKYISNPVSVIQNRFEVCSILEQKGVKCIFHGHQHVPYTGCYDLCDLFDGKHPETKMKYIATGSVSLSTGNSGMYEKYRKNSYNVYELNLNKRTIECSTFLYDLDMKPVEFNYTISF